MQPKISSFFKPPSSSSPTSKSTQVDTPSIFDDDELAIWENSQHQFFSTYKRRAPKSNHGDKRNEGGDISMKSTSKDVCLKQGTLSSGKVLNKKRSYAQYHLDFGQSDFNLRRCSTCWVKYAPGDEGDEKEHKIFHKNYTLGIQFKVLRCERVVHMPCTEGGRIVLVLDSDPPALRNKVQEVVKMMEIELGDGWIFHNLCKVYLFIYSQRVAGCLIAEPIKEAFKVLSCSVERRSSGAATKSARSNSTTLQFGEIILRREATEKVSTVNCHEMLAGNQSGAIICEDEAIPAVCGIRAIWVTPSNRRKHIASQLLDAARRSFCMGYALEKSQLAFSPPTSSGKALASSYIAGASPFLVYKPNNLNVPLLHG